MFEILGRFICRIRSKKKSSIAPEIKAAETESDIRNFMNEINNRIKEREIQQKELDRQIEEYLDYYRKEWRGDCDRQEETIYNSELLAGNKIPTYYGTE